MNAAKFRADFPEFADVAQYPDAQVNYWLGFGELMLRPERWGTALPYGLGFFAAHNLALWRQDMNAVSRPGVPGTPGLSTGATSSKTVDKVSVSYDQSAGLVEGAGHWNLTVYGKQFIQMSRMMGAGGIQLPAGLP